MSRVEINSQAPDFSMDDFKGETIRLYSYQPTWNVLLVFNRGFM